jgi:predicted CxxxxCH...CXXCH cytochrome family protein
MSPIKYKACFLLIALAALFSIITMGCSDANKKTVFDADSGKHPENWYTEHRTAYLTDPNVCSECHGADLHGGTSGVSCYSASFDGLSCHANGPVGHPSGWANPSSHGAAAKATPDPATTSGFSTCQSCHGADFAGGSTNQSCFTCHGVSAPHAPAPWRIFTGSTSTLTHVDTYYANGQVCAQCHLSSGAASDAGCFNNSLCHAVPNCVYCHTAPPSGSVAPNQAGAHASHYALAGLADGCVTCHAGAGIGTSKHNNGTVDVLFLNAYSATSGTAVHNADGSCSNVSCHGSSRTQTASQAASQTSTPGNTPAWYGGTIDVNSDCTKCHVLGSAAGNPENNSYYSGKHYFHVYDPNVNGAPLPAACTVCHDTAKLALVHFTSLTAPISEATASTTINSAVNFNGTTCSPNAALQLTGCHSGNFRW